MELQNVSKTYGSFFQYIQSFVKDVLGLQETKTNGISLRALDTVSLSVHAGERLGIIGQNGAGKSTLCQLIAGLIPVSSGTVKVKGRTTSIFALGLGLRDD
ncbi:MAG: ATP-binding cassette domain-containing protein, partial [Nitrospiraceae bacterium]